jgi:hypothetical protein
LTEEHAELAHVERDFGTVEIAGKTCSACGATAVAVTPMRLRGQGTGVVWACAIHAARMQVEGVPVFEIVRTCMMPVPPSGVPCGAPATHVSIVGVREGGRRQLRITSVCEQHTVHELVAARVPR